MGKRRISMELAESSSRKRVSVEELESLDSILSYIESKYDDSEDVNCMLVMYSDLLAQIVAAVSEADPIRGSICLKIVNEWLKVTEVYAFRVYLVILRCIVNNNLTLCDCREKAIDHMLDLLQNNIVKEEEESCLPWKKNKYKQRTYNIPNELVCKLRPYAEFLHWLVVLDEDDNKKEHLSVITTIRTFLREEEANFNIQTLLDNVHTNAQLLKIWHDRATKKDQKPAETNTLNPILDRLSEDDRNLLKRFRRKYQGVAVQLLDEYRKYHTQLLDSEGFDFDTYPGSFDNMTPIHPVGLYASEFENIDFKELAELAIHKSAKGKVKFEEVVRVNLRRNWCTASYYITFLGHCRKSLYYYKTLVEATFNTVTNEEAFKVLSFSRGPTKFGPSERKGTKKKVSCQAGGNSNYSTCEKHSKELSLLKSFIDMPERELLQKFREADRSTAAPLIKKLRQYFEQVSESEGFHIGQYPGIFPGVTSILKPLKWSLWCLGFIPLEKLARLATQSYNDENASQFVFDSIGEVNVSEDFHYHLYINFIAHDGDNVGETFQALMVVNMLLLGDYEVHFVRKQN